ncbi:MAG: hypothetical protein E7289_04525 [Lachnospiraceae bacterium]|nr:hypothetical protein [Lachnospiraceae bacterium]
MDKQKWGIKGLSKAGCYYLLFGAIYSALFTILSLHIKFENIKQSSLTVLFLFVSLFLFAAFYYAISQFEDPSKMILEFRPPKAEHRTQIQFVFESIYAHYSKHCKLKYAIAYPLSGGLILFGIAGSVMDSLYFLTHLKDVFVNAFALPAFFSGIVTFFTLDIVYRNRITEIREGAYAVTEVTLVEKYYCIRSGPRYRITDYFLILADSRGNKGRFKVCEDEYYRVHTDNTILLVKRSKGKLFYNAMEPVVITEQYRPTIEI